MTKTLNYFHPWYGNATLSVELDGQSVFETSLPYDMGMEKYYFKSYEQATAFILDQDYVRV